MFLHDQSCYMKDNMNKIIIIINNNNTAVHLKATDCFPLTRKSRMECTRKMLRFPVMSYALPAKEDIT